MRGRRRHPHAIGRAEGAAPARRPLIACPCERAAGSDDLAIVVGPDHDAVSADARRYAPKAQFFEQRERFGTAHAVLSAREAITGGADDILVMFGDTPLVRSETLLKLRAALADGAAGG